MAWRWPLLGSVWCHVALLLLWIATDVRPERSEISAPLQVSRVTSTIAIGHGVAGTEDQLVAERSVVSTGVVVSRQAGSTTGAPTQPTHTPPHAVPQSPERPAEDPAAAVDYVQTQPEDGVSVAPSDTVAISARHTTAPRPQRTPVTSERRGPLVDPSSGTADAGGLPTVARREGSDRARAGNRPTVPSEPVPITVGAGRGGAAGAGTAAGAPGAAGTQRAGGAVARAASGSSAGATGRPGGAGQVQPQLRPAPTGAHPMPDAPGWWHPLATRVEPARVRARAASATASAPAYTQGDGRSTVERPGVRADHGGAGRASDDEALPEEAVSVVGTAGRVASPGTADPVEELRADLGFGALDRDQLQPRPAWAGRLGAEGQADSSPDSVADVPIRWEAAVAAVGTPLGAWVERADALIARKWMGRDLDPHDRARGIQGQVTVQLAIAPNGRVTEVRVTQSSGNDTLDRMALGSIPARLPRLPREHAGGTLQHRVTLRYRNPLVAPGREE
ncbi:MAG: energy transducer TonB [Myxococcales bacterium]|nr:energy transducer TonB [Myxococcales bacterium]